jgi:hypothetical protein
LTPIIGTIASSTRQGLSSDAGSVFGINSYTVPSSGTNSITFSNIPQTYSHLRIVGAMRDSRAARLSPNFVRFNGDTGSNYSYHENYADSGGYAGGGSGSGTNIAVYRAAGSSAPSNMMGIYIIDIYDYTNTNKFKTLFGRGGLDSQSEGVIQQFSGTWKNTNAITSVTLVPFTAPYLQYSQLSLYGVL